MDQEEAETVWFKDPERNLKRLLGPGVTRQAAGRRGAVHYAMSSKLVTREEAGAIDREIRETTDKALNVTMTDAVATLLMTKMGLGLARVRTAKCAARGL